MQIAAMGTHQNGSRITIAGQGVLGFDGVIFAGIAFGQLPRMVSQKRLIAART